MAVIAAALLMPSLWSRGASAALPSGGVIRGRVDIQRPVVPPERRSTAIEPGDAPAREQPPRAVVYFESAPRGAFEDREAPHATLDQRDETFVPHVVAITAGTVVDFPNNDRTYHNVFSLSKPRRFDLGRYARGHSKSVRFDRPGIIRVFCDIHSHMNAFILVFAHRFYAVTDNEGRYEIDSVPPGSYTLSAWFEGSVREQRGLTLTPDARVAELDFVVK